MKRVIIALTLALAAAGCKETEIAAAPIPELEGQWSGDGIFSLISRTPETCENFHLRFEPTRVVMAGKFGERPWLSVSEARKEENLIRLVAQDARNPDSQKMALMLVRDGDMLRLADMLDPATGMSLKAGIANAPNELNTLISSAYSVMDKMMRLEKCKSPDQVASASSTH